MYVYVVTSVEMGWDCVCGVYTDYKSAVLSCFFDEDLERPYEELMDEVEDGETSYIIHQKQLEN